MKLGGGVHLGYCTNVHPGESWPEVRAALLTHVRAVRERVCPEGDFGVGLRLSARAADELAQPAALEELQDLLRRQRMYVFTINGFPHGSFHATAVKEAVYRPDWRDPERLRYTERLADLLAALLPADGAVEGSISTVPGAFKPALRGAADKARIVELLLRQVAGLVALRERCGQRIALALEPEPCCMLETADEAVDFFGRELHGPQAVRRVAALTGLAPALAEQALHDHLGVCWDLCHAAVEFEEPLASIGRLERAGIRIVKLQLSAGLRAPAADAAARAALARFVDPVYLHQVVQRSAAAPDALRRVADLPDALAGAPPAAGTPAEEWRVHFHVPLFLERAEPLATTQPFVREVLARQRVQPVSHHLEVETYTWDVLPAALRREPVDASIAREIDWVRGELGADPGGAKRGCSPAQAGAAFAPGTADTRAGAP
ncbi:MAG: metabolite traffic protein EboE [Burkholderiales bacterium]|nr:metabolite traffic protein EboE [Burkholderiales bacterium]